MACFRLPLLCLAALSLLSAQADPPLPRENGPPLPEGAVRLGSTLFRPEANELRICDAKTGAERFRLKGNGSGGNKHLQFSADGKRLIAWGLDLYLRNWDISNGKLISEYRILPPGVTEKETRNSYIDEIIYDLEKSLQPPTK